MTAPLDAAALLEPISADRPCGEDLEDSALLASFDAFQVFGQAIPLDAPADANEKRKPKPADSREWRDIRDKAVDALERSKDLRLLAYAGAAVLRTDGLAAFAETLAIAAAWLSRYWTDVHPPASEQAVFRKNALNAFGDQMAIIDMLRRTPLVRSRQHGSVSLRDVEIASGQTRPREGEVACDESTVRAAFGSAPIEELLPVQQAAAAAQGSVKEIAAIMIREGGMDAAPNFSTLAAQLAKIERVVGEQLALRPDGAGAGPASGTATEPPPAGLPGSVRSREEAMRLLDAVADFFRRTEPSSPVPLLVDRAKRLVAKDFLEVLADIAPDAVGQARAAGGLKE